MNDRLTKTPGSRYGRARWLIALATGTLILATILFTRWMTRGSIAHVFFAEIERQNGAPTWRGLIPGQTSRKEVMKELGKPCRTQTHDNIELLFYGRQAPCGKQYEVCHRVALQNEAVATIVLYLYDGSSFTPNVSLGDVVAEFGSPPAVEQNTLLYPELGLTFVVYEERLPSRAYQEIVEATYAQSSRQLEDGDLSAKTIIDYVMLYTPVSLTEYKETWGRFHPLDNPWASEMPRRVDQTEITPGKTTRKEVINLLGEPDIEGFALRFFQRYMIYRLPGWKDEYVLRVFLNPWGTVRILSGFVPADPPYRLEDAIVQYGVPDLIESPMPGDNLPLRSAIHLIMWQDEGLVYRTVKPAGNMDCSLPSHSLPSGWDPCPGPDDIVTAFRRIVPGSSKGSEIPYLPQFSWSP